MNQLAMNALTKEAGELEAKA